VQENMCLNIVPWNKHKINVLKVSYPFTPGGSSSICSWLHLQMKAINRKGNVLIISYLGVPG